MSDAGSDEEFPPLGTYEGERNRIKERNGEGVAVLPNKDKYKGQYHRGKRYGKGKYTYANKLDEYEGDYVVNQKHGYGVFLYKDGTSYHGMWSNNKYNGHGVYLYINNDWYAGQWKNGIKEGKGLYHYAETGIQLRGDWANGQFIKGDWLFADGMYTGGFKDGQPIGQGVFYYKSGVCQRGSFVKKGRSRVWVVDSYDRINPDDVEIATVEKKTEIRDTYIKLYTSPFFDEGKKETVYALFQKLGASDDEKQVSYLDLLEELTTLCGDTWSIPPSFLHELLDTLPLLPPPRDESSMVSFRAFWDATQSRPDVAETIREQVFRGERRAETLGALGAVPLDEDGAMVLGQALGVLVALAGAWGFAPQAEQVCAQLRLVEPFVDVDPASHDAEPVALDELWLRLQAVHVDVTRSVRVGVFEPEPEPEPQPDAADVPTRFVLDAAQKAALAAVADEGSVGLPALRQAVAELGAEWFAEEPERLAAFRAFVEAQPWFGANVDEDERAATSVQLAEVLASFGGEADGAAAAEENGGGEEDEEGDEDA